MMALFFNGLAIASEHGKVESYQDIISKAQNLVLQQDRKQAQNLLLAALKKEKKPAAIEAVRQSLRDISLAFISDKAQQLYETAAASFFTDTQASLSSLKEAIKIEPENVQVRQLELQHLLKTNQCDSARVELEKWSSLSPHFEELRLIRARSELCLGSFQTAEAHLVSIDKKSALAPFWTSLQMELHFRRGQFQKAIETYNHQAFKESLPELIYWRFKAESELKMKPEGTAQKYLALCKNIGARQRREFLLEPGLCTRVSEVETFLKKVNIPEI
jgi:predicted Zn-dependent protease